jgi:uncharacterized protein YxeA
MKKMLMILVSLIMISGCSSQKSEEEFFSHSSDLYVQMMMDGEQSEEVKDLYNQLVSDYKGYEDEELYQEVSNMYEALEGNGSAVEHQLKVMKILNEY